MKRLLSVVLFALVLLATAGAQQIYYQNQATLEWDAVTTDLGGVPLLPTDVVEYQVYMYDRYTGVANPQDPTQLTYVGATAATELLIVFPYRTEWAVGVRARVTDAGANIRYSGISWSDVAADTESGVPFWYVPYSTPSRPAGLRDSGT